MTKVKAWEGKQIRIVSSDSSVDSATKWFPTIPSGFPFLKLKTPWMFQIFESNWVLKKTLESSWQINIKSGFTFSI